MDVDDLRWTVHAGLEARDFSSLYLWVAFWGNGGEASKTKLDAFLRGQQALSESDVRVLDSVNAELGNI